MNNNQYVQITIIRIIRTYFSFEIQCIPEDFVFINVLLIKRYMVNILLKLVTCLQTTIKLDTHLI